MATIQAGNVEFLMSLKDLINQKLLDAQKNTEKVEQKLGGLESAFNKVALAGAGLFAASKIKDFAMSVVDTGAEFEKAQIGLATLLKSESAAKKAFEDIKKDAATTPFDINSLLTANKLLISTGMDAESSRGDVLNLANAIAATGGGSDELSRMAVNMQQIRNVGKATAVDIKQFAFAGINIYGLLAKATGKTTEEVKDLDVSYELLSSALKQAASAGGMYEGGLEKMANSTSVQISNLGDSMLYLKDDIFTGLKPAIDVIIKGMADLIGLLRDGVQWLKDNDDIVRSVAVGVGVLAGSVLLYRGFMFMANVQTAIANGLFFISAVRTLGLSGALDLLNISIGTTELLLGSAVVVVAAIAAGLYYAYQKSETFRAAIDGLWEAAKRVFTNIGNFFKQIFSPIFEAIDAFKEGRFADAAKAVGKAMFNLSPVGLAANAVMFASKGGFTEGVADAYTTGRDLSLQESAHRRWQEENDKKKAEEAAAALANGASGAGNNGPKGTLPSATSSGSKGATQVNVNIKEFGKFTINMKDITDVPKVIALIHQEIPKALTEALNDSQRLAVQ